jgi:hypothetical protein
MYEVLPVSMSRRNQASASPARPASSSRWNRPPRTKCATGVVDLCRADQPCFGFLGLACLVELPGQLLHRVDIACLGGAA